MMRPSSANTYTPIGFVLLLLFSATLILPCTISQAWADDRTAGAVPVYQNAEPAETAKIETPNKDDIAEKDDKADKAEKEDNAEPLQAPAAPDTAPPPKPKTLAATEENAVTTEEKPPLPPESTVLYSPNYQLLESYGVLDTAAEGALGVDLWSKSDYNILRSLISSLPAATPYPALNNLIRRALITTADAREIKKRILPDDGHDLMILRIAALSMMGDYEHAATLYKAYPAKPYSEKIARAGITALLGNMELSVACLETFSFYEDFAAYEFWTDLYGFCQNRFGKDMADAANANNPSSAVAVKSKIINNIIKDPYFRYTPSDLNKISALPPLEQLILLNENRYDYSKLTADNTESAAPALAALLVQDKNLPYEIRYKLILPLVRIGLRPPEDLKELYQSAALAPAQETVEKDNASKKETDEPAASAALSQPPKARLYARYYQDLTRSEDGNSTQALQSILKEAAAADDYAPFWPFAKAIADFEPEDYTHEMIRAAIMVMLTSSTEIPEKWTKLWKTSAGDNNEKGLLSLAILINQPSQRRSESNFNSNDISELSEEHQEIASITYEKLDISGEIFEYKPARAYEKQRALTLESNYGIPDIDLMEYLQSSARNRRLGELVLLSALMLHDGVTLSKESSMLLNEVLEGLTTVGLINESRALSKEIILDFVKI